jgi:thiosulfate/3-mercaptopyruvate sulfurtransferase
MAYTTLIDTADVARHIGDSTCALVDCRFALEDTAWGEREYEARHIPGAVYAHLDRDLSGPKTGRNGRHPLPAPDLLADTFSRLGIDADVQVVAYGWQTDMFPTRLWWLLRWLGHDEVAVLDGGFEKWIAERRPVSSGVETRGRRQFAGKPRQDMTVDATGVAKAVRTPGARVVDARAPERYRGDVEPLDKAAGHIPGATNYFFKENLDSHGLFLKPEALRRAFDAALGQVDAAQVLCYCGSGVSACHNLLALEHAGLHGAKLYPGSWSEWSSDPSRPVETGNAAGISTNRGDK